ncbi:MAG TPA: hypothetical protein VFA41_15495 [Ktedonobacteraceae bacterium]|jgi:hypothetical protein|nr:hypothetical protein [Ktedonobacteraceae bacterium]
MATTGEEIRVLIERLSPDYQQRVLEYAQALAQTQQALESLPTPTLPPGTPGKVLLRLTLPQEDAEAMERALSDCERIEPDEY